MVIATKFGSKMDDQRQGAKPDYIRRAVEDSLRRLGTERINLYQLHRPDPNTPVAETLEALDGLVKSGKVREIGSSNFSAEQIREADGAVRDGAARFISVQNEYSLMHRQPETDVLPECIRRRLAFLPYFPLANGKYGRKASLRRMHSGSTSVSGWRCMRLYSFCTLMKRAAPSRTAPSASRICSAEKFEEPISRTLPDFTKPSSASSVSATGVFGSGRCSWYKSMRSGPRRRNESSTARRM